MKRYAENSAIDLGTIPKVSIIVPIYNAENYLRQCLDSIAGQTLHDIEIILINDGSKDGSLEIINEYAKKDKRITVIDKPNEGYGKTMNRGLDKAAGEYIGIIESDDWIDPDMYEALYALAEKHDVPVVKSDFYEYTSTNGDIKSCILPEVDVEQVINPKERSNVFYIQPSIWAGIYRRDFINKHKIRFLESPGASYQDVGFNFKVWAMAEKAWLTPKAFLHYRLDNENQSVKSNDKVFCVVDEWAEIEKYMDNYPELKKASYQLRNHMKLNAYRWNLYRLEGEKREEFRKVFAAEYHEAVKNGGMKRHCLSLEDWLEFQKVLNPNNAWTRQVFGGIIRIKELSGYKDISLRFPVCKKIWTSGGIVKYYIFGCIPIAKRKVKDELQTNLNIENEIITPFAGKILGKLIKTGKYIDYKELFLHFPVLATKKIDGFVKSCLFGCICVTKQKVDMNFPVFLEEQKQ